MTVETKRDVLLYFGDYVLRNFNTPNIIFGGEQVAKYMQRYDSALQDDLPVIPKEVSDRLKQAKADRSSLRYMFAASSINMLSDWWMAQDPENEDTFSRAWLLGVWRVEETGEIVKLEAEK